jgi:hypothetical protein
METGSGGHASAGKRGSRIATSEALTDDLPDSDVPHKAKKPSARALSPAARRALAEAAARRAETKPMAPPEHNGRGGLDPARYGDWEVKGLASDF